MIVFNTRHLETNFLGLALWSGFFSSLLFPLTYPALLGNGRYGMLQRSCIETVVRLLMLHEYFKFDCLTCDCLTINCESSLICHRHLISFRDGHSTLLPRRRLLLGARIARWPPALRRAVDLLLRCRLVDGARGGALLGVGAGAAHCSGVMCVRRMYMVCRQFSRVSLCVEVQGFVSRYKSGGSKKIYMYWRSVNLRV
jgi:hypothetical protein